MPNHCQNVLIFNTDIDPDVLNTPIDVPDRDIIAAKLGVLILVHGVTEEIEGLLNESDMAGIVERVDELYAALSAAQFQQVASALKNTPNRSLPECFRAIFSGDHHWFDLPPSILDSLPEAFEAVQKPTPLKGVAPTDHSLWFPREIGIDVWGFNGSLSPFATLNFKRGYDDNIDRLGTKWGVYEVIVDGNEIGYNTAWSPLNEEALFAFCRHLRSLTGANPYEFCCAEQGAGYMAYAVIDLDEIEASRCIELECLDLDTAYIDRDEFQDEDGFDEAVKALEDRGYQVDSCDSYGAFLIPKGGDYDGVYDVLKHWGFGG